jgi:hypothetical protein
MTGRWGTDRGETRRSSADPARAPFAPTDGGQTEATRLGRELRGFFGRGSGRRRPSDIARELSDAMSAAGPFPRRQT